jgi:hypothetical protein
VISSRGHRSGSAPESCIHNHSEKLPPQPNGNVRAPGNLAPINQLYPPPSRLEELGGTIDRFQYGVANPTSVGLNVFGAGGLSTI